MNFLVNTVVQEELKLVIPVMILHCLGKRERNKFCKNQAKSDRKIEMPIKDEKKRDESVIPTNLSDTIEDTKLKLAFAFQSTGWQGSLLDRLNTFSYLDLYKKRISKVKSKTADIKDVIEDIEGKVRDGR